MSKTVQITSPNHFNELISSNNIIVVDFYADWCGPCKTIAPIYEQLSSQLSRPQRIAFTRVNVDNQQQVARSFNVTAMPTFLILKNRHETKRITGANPKALQDAVQTLAREAESLDSNPSASGSASADSGAWAGLPISRGYSDITDHVDIRGIDILNYDTRSGTPRTIFERKQLDSKGNKKDAIESDTDEQLMIYIPFTSTVKVYSLQIASSATSTPNDPMRPKTIKVFQNKNSNIDFDEAESMEATQVVTLKPGDWDEKTNTAEVGLRFVKFQKCSNLVVFVVEGEGSGERCRVDRIRVVGEAGEKKTMGKLEKVGEEH